MKTTTPAEKALQKGIEANVSMWELQRLYALFIVEQCQGNVAEAARRLGVGDRTLRTWRQRMRNDPRFKEAVGKSQ